MKSLTFLVLVLLTLSGCSTVNQDKTSPATITKESSTKPMVETANQAYWMAKRRYRARIIKVEDVAQGYLVKLVTEKGRFMDILVDAQTGQMKRQK